jgi:hypothetical protein
VNPGPLPRVVLVQETAVEPHLLDKRLFLRQRLLKDVHTDHLANIALELREPIGVDREAAILVDQEVRSHGNIGERQGSSDEKLAVDLRIQIAEDFRCNLGQHLIDHGFVGRDLVDVGATTL